MLLGPNWFQKDEKKSTKRYDIMSKTEGAHMSLSLRKMVLLLLLTDEFKDLYPGARLDQLVVERGTDDEAYELDTGPFVSLSASSTGTKKVPTDISEESNALHALASVKLVIDEKSGHVIANEGHGNIAISVRYEDNTVNCHGIEKERKASGSTHIRLYSQVVITVPSG